MRAEELGFESAWVQDQVAGDVPLLESVSLLCYAAAVTERGSAGRFGYRVSDPQCSAAGEELQHAG